MAKIVGLMAGPSVAVWLLVALVVGRPAAVDVLLGMAGPLVVACGAWVVMERAYRRSPQQLTAVMIAAFAGKLVFFAVYVAVMIRGVGVAPVPFIASFTGYFIGLYALEALFLKRLFAGT